jgi:hypothetical protein
MRIIAATGILFLLAGEGLAVASVTSPASGESTDDREAHPARSSETLEHMRIGVLGGLGFPRPFSIEAMMKLERVLAVGAEYSFLPSMNVGGVDLSYRAVAVDMRLFPLGSPFFLGVRFGRQHLAGATTIKAAQYGAVTEAVTMDTWFLNPRIGVLWTSSAGVSLGLEAGVQVPLSHTSSTTLPQGLEAPASVTRVTDTFGASVLPTLSLLQAGMMF